MNIKNYAQLVAINLVIVFAISLLFVFFKYVSEEPVSQPEIPFVWDLQDADLLSAEVMYQDARVMLREVDLQLSKNISHSERVSYLQVRIQLLYHIKNLNITYDVQIEGEQNGE